VPNPAPFSAARVSKPRRGAWVSPAGAAAEAGCPVWIILMLVRMGRLHITRINGMPRISRRELETLLSIHRPASAVAV
jgi:hypothetical protein